MFDPSKETHSPWHDELDSDRPYKLLINGEFVTAQDERSFPCQYPYTGEFWGAAPLATPKDVDHAVQSAHKAFEQHWGRTRPAERAALLRKLADLILRDAHNLAMLQVHENGKLLSETQHTGQSLAALAHYMSGLAESSVGQASASNLPNTTSYSIPEPIGVVAAITPWNSPLGLLSWKLFPALAAGNSIVIKPSEVTPLSTLRLGELCMEAGFPDGVINIVTGDGGTGAALVEHPLVDKIAFTGATGTGQSIARTAASRNARISLELGGKSPNIVFDDADLDKAIDGIIAGIFSSTGQSCVSGSRILVQSNIGDDFYQELARRVNAMRLGDPLDPTSQIAPLASRAHMDKILSYLDIAQSEGLSPLVGGGRPSDPALANGFFVQPTLYAKVSNHHRIAREEIFGPIGSIINFSDEEDAIRIANDTPFGLAAAVWTESIRRAHRIVPRLRAGTVWVNQYRSGEFVRPFGGYRQSGVGRELGVDALHAYSEMKSVFISH